MSLRLKKRTGSPYWWISGTVSGCNIRESTGTERRDLAEIKRAARENDIYRGQVHGPLAVRHTFAAVSLSYLEHGGPHSESTRARVGRLLEHIGASLAADDVDQARIDKACSAFLRPGSAPATRLREVISPARAILTHGSKRRLCMVPVFDAGKPSPSRTEWMTPTEVDAMIAAAIPHIKPLLAFMAATGARVSEALSLDWRDVNLGHRRAVLRDTKNGKDRQVDLCPRAVAALESIMGSKRRLKPAEPCSRVGHVFRTKVGEPYKVYDEALGEDSKAEAGGGQIKKAWASARKKAGLDWKPVTPHSLRHTWASWHYAMNRDLLLLRFEGDWSSVKLVERYAHLTPGSMAGEIRAWRDLHTFSTDDRFAAD